MSRLWNQGYWYQLSPQCQTCQNRKTMSVKMDGNHYYCCGKYPLRVGDKCLKYKPEPPNEETNGCGRCDYCRINDTGTCRYGEET